MSHRIGTCASCGATYKLPASFAADKAACKQCDGVVEIGPVEGGGPAPSPEPVPAAPVPAKPVAPSGKAGGTAKKKGSGPSMKEKLLAQRRAGAEAAGSEKPAAPKKPAPAKKPTRAAKPAAVRKRPAAGKGEQGADESASKAPRRTAAAAGRRRTSGRSKREEGGEDVRERLRKSKKSPLVPALSAFAALALAAGGIWYMSQPKAAEPSPDEGIAAVETPGEGTADAGGEAAADVGQPDPEPEPEPDPEPEPEPKPKPVNRKDPANIDLTLIEDYGPIAGQSEEDFLALQRLAKTMVDPEAGAAGNRARMSLAEAAKNAFPVVLNVMKDIDYSTEQGFRDGDLCQRLLMEICNGNNFGWKYSAAEEDEWYNKFVVQRWCTQWDRAKDDEAYWLKFSKQDSQPAGGEPSGGAPAISDDDLDDLDELDG
ncbi:MAG: hypothetical protein QF410_02035 [Planctomycetota bacterium]|jgi:hypothetical protein|nr:hypothetical protein [Planctomycetota bacterium]